MPTDPDRPSLPRVLSLVDVTASGVGIIVGAGIYVLLGPATERAGGLVWLAFVLSAVVCGLTALSYAELSSMFPRAGGEYEYARHSMHRHGAFMVGWTMLAGLTVAGATVALGFARYFNYFWPIGSRWAALGLLVAMSSLAALGIRRSTWVVVAFSVVQIGGLLFVSAVGLHHIGEVDLLAGSGDGWFASARGVATSVALVFFAFIGFDEVTTLSEETQDPTRTTPRALLGALAISSLLYVLVSVTAVSVLGPDELARSEQPLRDVVATAVGDDAGAVMAVLAMITTANTVLLVITAATRMLFAMARQGDLPRRFEHLDARGTPRRATVAVALAAAVFVLVGRFELVASATDVAVYATFLFVNFIVIALRLRRPDIVRAFRVPISIGRVPVVPVVATVVTIWMVALLEFRAIAVAGGIMSLGLVMSLVRGSRPKTFG